MWRNSHWSFSQGPVLRADWLEAFVWAHFKNKTGAGLPRIHTYTERLTHTNPHSLFVLELSLTRGGKGATASSWCCLSEVCVCAAILYSYAHYSTQPPPDSVITGLSMCTWAQTHTCGLNMITPPVILLLCSEIWSLTNYRSQIKTAEEACRFLVWCYLLIWSNIMNFLSLYMLVCQHCQLNHNIILGWPDTWVLRVHTLCPQIPSSSECPVL